MKSCVISLLIVWAFARIEGQTGDNDSLKTEEYLILLKKSAGVTASSVPLPVQQTLYTGEVGGHGFLHVRATEQQHQLLLHNNLIRTIEPNPVFRTHLPAMERAEVKNVDDYSAHKSGAACTEQNPYGIWGLVRTSYANIPDYENDTYRYESTGAGVDIYFLDSGIDVGHEEFWTDAGYSRATHGFVSEQFAGEGETDFTGHGTWISSVAAGKRRGMAKDANVISVKVIGSGNTGTPAGITSGILYVRDRVRAEKTAGRKVRAIINMSLIYGSFSQIIADAVQEVTDEGVVVVAMAGDAYVEVVSQSPASFDTVITTTHSNQEDMIAPFANYGPKVDLFAPGVGVTGAGSRNMGICSESEPGKCYIFGGGTSLAASHVTGAVARYLQSVCDEDLDDVTVESMKQLLITWSTKNKMSFRDQEDWTTPDRLLYMGCGATPPCHFPTTTTTSSTTTTTTSSTTTTTSLSSTTTTRSSTTTTASSTTTSDPDMVGGANLPAARLAPILAISLLLLVAIY